MQFDPDDPAGIKFSSLNETLCPAGCCDPMTTSDWLQVSLPGADLLLGRQEAEHPRVPQEEGAGGDAAREYPEDAGRQRGVQTSPGL